MKTTKTIAVIAATLLLCAGASAQAQIVWSTPTTISTDTDVATNGTLLYADYVGVGSGADVVNGVSFAEVDATSSAGLTFDAAGDYGVFAPTDGVNGYSGSSAYTLLLNGAYYASPTDTMPVNTLTLSGLTVDQTYEVELFEQDGRGGRAGVYSTTFSDGGSVTLDPSNTDSPTPGVGQFVLGDFVATGSTEVIDITSGQTAQLNAFQVRDEGAAVIPEPSTVALMGVAGLAFLAIRRRHSLV